MQKPLDHLQSPAAICLASTQARRTWRSGRGTQGKRGGKRPRQPGGSSPGPSIAKEESYERMACALIDFRWCRTLAVDACLCREPPWRSGQRAAVPENKKGLAACCRRRHGPIVGKPALRHSLDIFSRKRGFFPEAVTCLVTRMSRIRPWPPWPLPLRQANKRKRDWPLEANPLVFLPARSDRKDPGGCFPDAAA